ncbi:PIN domain-containing protein [Streptomyces capparidis]
MRLLLTARIVGMFARTVSTARSRGSTDGFAATWERHSSTASPVASSLRVLDELDRQKHGQGELAKRATTAIRYLDRTLKDITPAQQVQMRQGVTPEAWIDTDDRSDDTDLAILRCAADLDNLHPDTGARVLPDDIGTCLRARQMHLKTLRLPEKHRKKGTAIADTPTQDVLEPLPPGDRPPLRPLARRPARHPPGVPQVRCRRLSCLPARRRCHARLIAALADWVAPRGAGAARPGRSRARPGGGAKRRGGRWRSLFRWCRWGRAGRLTGR